jgi:hypothetical protein
MDAADYREQAVKLFPWVCGRRGREFNGKNLRELTVHHKDHDHGNNPRIAAASSTARTCAN